MRIVMKNGTRVVITVLIASLLAVGTWFLTNRQPTSSSNSQESSVKLVSAREFEKLSQNPQAFILDVHIPEQEHIPGTDAYVPYNEIQNNTAKLPEDKNTPLLVYCRSGSMSRQASVALAKMGYANIYDLEGGIDTYKKTIAKVTITPPQKDLGKVIYGDITSTNFTLTNFTPIPLVINRISTSCSCTSAEVAKRELEPFGSTEVSVSFNPAVHKDDTDIGEQTKTIFLDTNNPDFKQVSALITANVVKQ